MSKLEKIHSEALLQFDNIQSAMREERMQCLQDRRFYSISGAQWDGTLSEQFENKPRFEVNKVHLSIIRIINEYRNNRITVDFIPKNGEKNDKVADLCDGLYRADEKDSSAEEAYDNAFEEAVAGGFGAFRLRADYENDEDDEDERQRIKIEPIFDADSSVFFDLNAKKQDKSDAQYCFVLTSMTNDAYESEFNEDIASFNKDITQTQFDWYTPDVVFVAEYYKIEKIKEVVQFWKDKLGNEQKYTKDDFENDDELEEYLKATGWFKAREKKYTKQKVHKYILSGAKVLEDCGIIAGKYIPIVPVYGKRWFVDNIERCMGHVRLAKDVQRLKNMQLSKLGEIAALSSVEKPILTPEQIMGHQQMWADDNIKNYPYLLINPITDINGNSMPSGPLAYTHSPQIPPTLAALLQITDQDIQMVLGNQQAGEQIVSNISGKAIELIQNRLDMQTFIYMSNMAKAVKRSGEIWLSMAKDLLVEEGRKLKTIGQNGESGTVEILKPIINDDGEQDYQNDLSKADFDVNVDVGPSSDSKRAATVRSITGLMQITQDPETLQVLSGLALLNMEGEGISDVRKYFRAKLIRMGALEATEEEMAQMQQENANRMPDANSIYLEAEAERAKAEAAKLRAGTLLDISKAEESKAKTAKTLSEIDASEREQIAQALEIIKNININA